MCLIDESDIPYIIWWKGYGIKYNPLITWGSSFPVGDSENWHYKTYELAKADLDKICQIKGNNPDDFAISQAVFIKEDKPKQKSTEELKEITERIRAILLDLSDTERELVMRDFLGDLEDSFCRYCWRKLGERETCYCWNDE